MVNEDEVKGEPRRAEKQFYDTFWKELNALSCDEKCRMRFILSEIRRLRAPGLRLADVGSGRGWLTELMSHFGDATGFDQSTVIAQRRYPNRRFVECDATALPKGDFDVAVCSEVIEHVSYEEQPALVRSLFSILKEGGTLVMTTPNKPRVASTVQKLSLQNELQPIENWLDPAELARLVSPHFDIEKLGTVMFFPAAVRKIGPLSRLYRMLYEEAGGYRIVDPLLQRTRLGLYIALVAKRRSKR
jgi:2-polyprenyl-3-methyl-5-hydroxy-6-metoxy-1,4-benzoquinol methylase